MENKQTAVEWLKSKLTRCVTATDERQAFEQAKQMHKEQIIEAAHHGVDFENSPYENAEQYYDKTYGN